MSKRVVIDPITRIEGHLRIEVEVDENNVINKAWSSSTLWRGIEVILKGRTPMDVGLIVHRAGIGVLWHVPSVIVSMLLGSGAGRRFRYLVRCLPCGGTACSDRSSGTHCFT